LGTGALATDTNDTNDTSDAESTVYPTAAAAPVVLTSIRAIGLQAGLVSGFVALAVIAGLSLLAARRRNIQVIETETESFGRHQRGGVLYRSVAHHLRGEKDFETISWNST
jgi:hypothetical protein